MNSKPKSDISLHPSDVSLLKNVMASQVPYIALLLALSKLGIQPHRADIEKAIDSLSLGYSPDANETKRQAKKLIPLYFS